MQIAIDDGFSTSRVTGVGRYTWTLLAALRRYAPELAVTHLRCPQFDRLRPRPVRRAAYLAWLLTTYPRQLADQGVQVAHFTNFQVPGWKPAGMRFVVTFHDLTAFLWPAFYSPAYMAYLRVIMRQAVRLVDCVLADSEVVRQEILQGLPITPERVKVCYSAPALQALPLEQARSLVAARAPSLAYDPFLLFVGRLERRKNLVPLIEAFGNLLPRWPQLRLVLAGQPGIGMEQIEAALRRLPCGRERVHWLRECSDDELRALYTTCAIFVLPSHYEGYGLPLVEAMACGAPILVSDIPTAREVCQAAAQYAAPTAVGLEAGAATLLAAEDLRAHLVAVGRARVAAVFSLERTAQQLIAAYRS